MVLACIVTQAIDELVGQAPRLELLALWRGTSVGTTALRMTTDLDIVITLVRGSTS